MNIHIAYSFFSRKFRPKRAAEIVHRFPLLADPNAQVLDVGGWLFPWELIQPRASITILNIDLPPKLPEKCPWKFVKGNGTRLQFPDAEFDLVFSNSVIEHVGNLELQKAFASEMLRCGREIYFQTPNKWFFVEPHLIAPFLH